MNKKLLIRSITFASIFIMSFLVLAFPNISNAETQIYAKDVQKDWVWDEAGSPYIIKELIYLPPEDNLLIKEGVVVKIDPSLINRNFLVIDGGFKVLGTRDKPVIFSVSSMANLILSNNTSIITNALFDGTGLNFDTATSTINSVTIRNTYIGINLKFSNIRISSTTISDSNYGITANDLRNIELGLPLNKVSISKSRIINIKIKTIINFANGSFDARDNWWGQISGPNLDNIFSPYAQVITEPWLLEDPYISVPKQCCSSVLFLPGFEASRLYKDNTGLFGSFTNTLWEPNRNADVEKLYMDDSGKSLDSSIHTKDIIGNIAGIKNIYQSFIDTMDKMVDNGDINNWLPFPYDWRNGVSDIVDSAMLDKVIDLAANSKSKKITIIAHSNGGLLAKNLVRKLEEKGIGEIVDNIIYVAVPELGTPEAILSMLHGHNQSIAAGAILTENNARTFARNTPGAYGLLPSKKFFSQNPITLISDMFKTNTNILSFDSMKNFLLNNTFSNFTDNTSIPILLNRNIFEQAESLHSKIDDWKPSSTTKTLSIFGWGLPTSSGVQYKASPHCDNGNSICPLEAIQLIDKSGDGTVLTKANSNNSDSTLYLNLDKLNSDRDKDINHANILESVDLLKFLTDKITENKTTDSSYDKYFTTTEPIDESMTVKVTIHSPVDIDLYDDKGRHTGIVKNPNPDSDIDYFEDRIPGTHWDSFGGVKSAILPFNRDIKIELSGNDAGVFIVDAELKKGDTIIASTSFSELPIIPTSKIDLVIGTTTETFASSTNMQIDIDGDNFIDFISHSNTYLEATGTNPISDLPTYLESMKKVILSLKLPIIQEKHWLDRIEKVTDSLEKNKYKKVDKIVKKIVNKKYKDNGKHKELTTIQRSIILKMFENVLNYIENDIIDSKSKT